MNLKRIFLFSVISISSLILSQSFAQNGVPKAFNVQGTIYQPASNNPFVGLANIRFQLLNEAATCVMYQETVTGVDTTNTNGAFSVDLGTTATRINNIDSTTSLGINLFKNNVTHASITGCVGPITIGASEKRKLRIGFDVGSGFSDMTPDIEILSAPYAMIAETLDGHTASEFILANTSTGLQLSQTNLETLLNNITKFNTLNNFATTGNITGNAATATTAAAVSDGAITAAKLAQMGASNGQVMKWNGASWVASNDNSGVATVTSSDITTAMGYTPVSSSGTVANATNAVSATTATNFSGSLSGDVSGTQSTTIVNSIGGKSSAQVATSVNETLTATNANTINTIVKRDASGNIAVSNLSSTNVSSTNNSIQNLYLFDNTNTNRILFKAPNSGITNYTLTLPATLGTNGQVLSTNASGDLGWVTPSSGNVTSVAGRTGVVILSSSDISGLAFGTTTGTFAQGDDGRFTDQRTPTDNSVTSAKILDGTITSADLSNASIEANKLAQMGASSGQVLKWDGSAWVASSDGTNAGSVTSVTSATPDITISNTTTTPQLTLNAAVSGADKILKLNGSGKIDASTIPSNLLTTSSSLSGDVSGTNTTTSVDRIKGINLNFTSLSSGNFLNYDGINWINKNISVSDLKTSLGAQQFANSCATNQTLTWSAVTDAFSCSNIAISISQISGLANSASVDTTNASNISSGTLDAARLPATVTDGLWTANASGDVSRASGNVGVGTTSPNSHFEIAGARNTWNGAAFRVKSTDTGNQTYGAYIYSDDSFKIGDITNSRDNIILYPTGNISLAPVSGNVGVGTASPSYKLHVAGNSAIDAGAAGRFVLSDGFASDTNANSPKLSFFGVSSGAFPVTGPSIQAINTAAFGNKRLAFFQHNGADYTAETEVFSILSSGNVGIGTTSPTAKLTLSSSDGTASSAPLKFIAGTNLSTPENGAMEFDGTDLFFTSGGTRRTIANTSGGALGGNVSAINNSGGSITMTPSTGNSVIVNQTTSSTNTTTGALIVSGGVGVAENLNVGGNIASSGSIAAQTSILSPVLYGSSASSGDLTLDSTSNGTKGNIILAPNGGNVGIGTASPNEKLQIAGNMTLNFGGAPRDPYGILNINAPADANSYSYLGLIRAGQQPWGIGINTGNNFSIGIPSSGTPGNITTSVITATIAGNVGIGTASPTGKLSVNGNVYIDNFGFGGTPLISLAVGDTDTGLNTSTDGALDIISNGVNTMNIRSGNVGIGTTSPNAKLTLVADAPYSTSSGGISITTSSDQTLSNLLYMSPNSAGNYAAIQSYKNGTGPSSLLLNASGGNVGIGTTSPGAKLTIRGDSRIETFGATNPIDYKWTITGPTSDYDTLYLGGETATGNETFQAANGDGNQIMSFKAAGQNKVGVGYDAGATSFIAKFAVNGNVGIGTTTPADRLQIKASSNSSNPLLVENSASNNIFNVNADASGNGAIAVRDQFASVLAMISSSGNSYFNGGNVGIGTTAPAQKLSVTDSLSITNSAGIQYLLMGNQDSAGVNNPAVIQSANGTMSFGHGTSWSGTGGTFSSTMTVDANNGRVGIGTNAPYQKFSVVGSDGGTMSVASTSAAIGATSGVEFNYNSGVGGNTYNIARIMGYTQTGGGGDLLFQTAPSAAGAYSTKMTILQGGNVGIGTTNPSYQLQLSTDSAAKPGTSTWTIASDERLKDIRAPFTRGLNELMGLNTIYFNYKKENPLDLPSNKEFVGIRAQDAQKVIPESVSTDEKGFLHVTNDSIIWTAVNAIKELYNKVLGLDDQLAIQSRQIGSIESSKADKTETEFLKAKALQLEIENTQLKAKDIEKTKQLDNMKAYLCSKDPAAFICK